MFSQISQPLLYAESLLERFCALARAADSHTLLSGLVSSAAQLSGCALSQLYLLDDTHTRLTLSAQHCDGEWQAPAEASLSSDYDGEQLLQYCLLQNQTLCLRELDSSLHQASFLPDSSQPWRSLLCQPLLDEQQQVNGLLVVASQQATDLHSFACSLGQIGSFAISHLHLLQRLRQPALNPTPVLSSKDVSGYGLIGDSAAMRSVYQMISKVLHNPMSVLLTGETGTGKELVAHAIHNCGLRRSKKFVVQNCASLPEALLESELFGYRKGAFSGADRDHQGLFDAANGGTLFLDEIGDMPLSLQAKLLRVLQEGEVRPLGCNETHTVDVRIIAATHHNLRNLVENGQFREDLFYRLSQFPIELPPLRQREQDILTLARYFADKATCLLQRESCQWADDALEQLASYSFPGNVRELKGLVERAVLLCDGSELLPEHFYLPHNAEGSESTESDASNLSLRERMERVERSLLIDCLRKNGGNQTNAAGELGLPRRTLLYRMQRLNISPADV